MDIGTQSEIILREAGYDTWTWTGASPPVTCFENATLAGFIHVFSTASDLLAGWEEAERRVLSRHASPLRAAGEKAWNIYSVFLTTERAPDLQRSVERLEENFALTRKIARVQIQTSEDLAHALLPLSPIKAQPTLDGVDVSDRLRTRAKDIPEAALLAFLGPPTPEEVAEILGNIR